MSNRTPSESWNVLEALETAVSVDETDMDTVLWLSRSTDPELRMRTAELLGQCPFSAAEPILLTLSSDTNMLVRTAACDSLSGYSGAAVCARLMQVASDDPVYLVRGYAILSLGDTTAPDRQQQTRVFLTTRYRREKSVWGKIACASSLYRLGCRDYLPYILQQIDNRDYRIRCLVLHVLQEIADPDMAREIAAVLENRWRVERAESVRRLLKERITALTALLTNDE